MSGQHMITLILDDIIKLILAGTETNPFLKKLDERERIRFYYLLNLWPLTIRSIEISDLYEQKQLKERF